MEKKISQFINENKLNIDNIVICAVSGGADSVALISILHNLGYKVVLAHVNHHKRLQSEVEEKAMMELANKLNVPFELLSYHYTGNDNFHNDSHNARYDFFRSLCKKYNTDIIATAHHADDQLETVLIKIMEGSNLYGYGGISICNNDGEFRIIRPLLCVGKNDLYDYVKKHNLAYFEDSSNHEDGFLRNRIRHHVSPLLKDECSDINNKIMQYSIQVHEAFDYIRRQSIKYLDSTNNIIKYESFSAFDIAVQKDIISLLLERYNINKTYSLINDILRFVLQTNGSKLLVLANGYKMVRSYNETKIESYNFSSFENNLIISENPIVYRGKYRIYFSKNVVLSNAKCICLCYNDLKLPLTVRVRKTGDEVITQFGTKKVSRVLIDKKISKNLRDDVPIIVDSDNNILWVFDLIKSKSVYEQKTVGNIYLVVEVIDNA